MPENRCSGANLRARMASFYAQPRDLLAVEPGGYDREAQRHEEFKDSRLGRAELFEPTEDLLAHIEIVRMTFGDPAKFLVPQ
jgi:hypothetical protein